MTDFKMGDIVSIEYPYTEDTPSPSEQYQRVLVGRIVSLDMDERILCVDISPPRNHPDQFEPRDEGDHEELPIGARVTLRVVDFDLTKLRVLYVKQGGVVRCESVWIDKGMIRFSYAGGRVGIPINAINVSNSSLETVRKELRGEAFERIPVYTANSGRKSNRTTTTVHTGSAESNCKSKNSTGNT